MADTSSSTVPLAQPGAPELGDALRKQLAQRLSDLGTGHQPRTRNLRANGTPLYTNRLLLESSPYLQQHAHNPVDWYPWGDEAFETARRLGRPVLVSIGYSTCHWCHVMEEESYDDPDTAKYLNQHYISIKVDRETRPDVDAVYMAAVQAMNIRGGWPLNVFLTPDREPFYGGTYFPKTGRGQRPGFMQLLEALQQSYSTDPAAAVKQADMIAEQVRKILAGSRATSSRVPDAAALHRAVKLQVDNADPEWGGQGTGLKFPSSMPVRLLFRYHRRSGDAAALAVATLSLEKMAAGGIHDHVGGGFHRYSTDRYWRVPHFEKMLYDNALIAQDYLEAWQLTGRDDFANVCKKTLAYVAREMTAPGGGFYSATDADSMNPEGEMEEGWFFTWTPDELGAVLGAERAREITAYYGVTTHGNFEGRNIFTEQRSSEDVAKELGIRQGTLLENLEESRTRLYDVRANRPAPLRDDKILVAWNGLMISAFANAGFAFDDKAMREQALAAAHFILDNMRAKDGRLIRVYKDGRAQGPAFLEDYAFFIAALMDLYEASSDARWLANAIALQKLLDAHYRDDAGGGYYQTADDGEELLVREKPTRDGATPSGNSISALNLLRLYEFTTDLQYIEGATMLFSANFDALQRGSPGMALMHIALDYQLDTAKEVVIVHRDPGPALNAMLEPLRKAYLPNRIVSIVREGDELEGAAKYTPLVKGKRAIGKQVTAYVCENRVCAFPTNSAAQFAKQLAETREYAD